MITVFRRGVLAVMFVAMAIAAASAQTTVTRAAGPTTGTQKAAMKAVQTTGPVVLTGRSFSSPEFTPPHFEAGNMQLVAHYGRLQARADLFRPAKRVRVQLKPRCVEGSQPVVGLLFERRGRGPYIGVTVMVDEPVKDANAIVKDVALEPGLYNVTLQYFKSTGTARTALEIHKITIE